MSAIVLPMRGRFRRTLILSMAVLFAASGFAARYCMAAHLSNSHTVVAQSVASGAAHHEHAAGHGDHAQHGLDGSHHHGAPDGKAPATGDDVACAKCCGTCTLATAVMPDVASQVVFIVTPAVFACAPEHCSEATVRVDPGIPKRIS